MSGRGRIIPMLLQTDNSLTIILSKEFHVLLQQRVIYVLLGGSDGLEIQNTIFCGRKINFRRLEAARGTQSVGFRKENIN